MNATVNVSSCRQEARCRYASNSVPSRAETRQLSCFAIMQVFQRSSSFLRRHPQKNHGCLQGEGSDVGAVEVRTSVVVVCVGGRVMVLPGVALCVVVDVLSLHPNHPGVAQVVVGMADVL